MLIGTKQSVRTEADVRAKEARQTMNGADGEKCCTDFDKGLRTTARGTFRT